LRERLPFICRLASRYVGVDAAKAPIPVRPAMHYSMGGVATDRHTATELPGLFAAGECASVGLHGANRLGSNSLAELLVFGRVAGERAVAHARDAESGREEPVLDRAREHVEEVEQLRRARGDERASALRDELTALMDEAFGVYRLGNEMEDGLRQI